ncbi:MAG: hypothetical protein JNL10_19600 [Verrucomicrobiales bacterium]|nr:hypothetical protein [Verrucomicrobiales bacterium]
MKRPPAGILALGVAVCLCTAISITLRSRSRGTPSRNVLRETSPDPSHPSTREVERRFTRDPERLRALWEQCLAHQGPDAFTEEARPSNAPPVPPSPYNLVMTAIWRQGGKSLAVINGRIVPEESEFTSHRITRIGSHDAELIGPGGRIHLSLTYPGPKAAGTARDFTLLHPPTAGVVTASPAPKP